MLSFILETNTTNRVAHILQLVSYHASLISAKYYKYSAPAEDRTPDQVLMVS